MKLNKNDYYLS